MTGRKDNPGVAEERWIKIEMEGQLDHLLRQVALVGTFLGRGFHLGLVMSDFLVRWEIQSLPVHEGTKGCEEWACSLAGKRKRLSTVRGLKAVRERSLIRGWTPQMDGGTVHLCTVRSCYPVSLSEGDFRSSRVGAGRLR